MKWEKLICAERQQAKEEKPKQFEQFDIDAFDDDFLSIISSQAFRPFPFPAHCKQVQAGQFRG